MSYEMEIERLQRLDEELDINQENDNEESAEIREFCVAKYILLVKSRLRYNFPYCAI